MRKLRFLALLTSVLPCATVLIFWARSMSTADVWRHSSETSENSFWVHEGRIVWERSVPSQIAPGLTHGEGALDDVSSSIAEDWLRIDFGNRKPSTFDYTSMVTPGTLFIGPVSRTIIVFPAWAVAALFSEPAVMLMLSRVRSARFGAMRNGACPHCGYDLRATPGRCAECGMPA